MRIALMISAYSVSSASATLAFMDFAPFQAGHRADHLRDVDVMISAYFVVVLLLVTPASMEEPLPFRENLRGETPSKARLHRL